MPNNKILLEFKKSDLAKIVADNDSFTIAYEIELETEPDMIRKHMEDVFDAGSMAERAIEWARNNINEMPVQVIKAAINMDNIVSSIIKQNREDVIKAIAEKELDKSFITIEEVEELVEELIKLNDIVNIYDQDYMTKLILAKHVLKNDRFREELNEVLPINLSNPGQPDLFDYDDADALVRYTDSLSKSEFHSLFEERVYRLFSEEEYRQMQEEIWDYQFDKMKDLYREDEEDDEVYNAEKDYFDELKEKLILSTDLLEDKILDIEIAITDFINNLSPERDFYYAKDDIGEAFEEAGIFDLHSEFEELLDTEMSDSEEEIATQFVDTLENLGRDMFFEEFEYLEGYKENMLGIDFYDEDEFLRHYKESVFASSFPTFWRNWGNDLFITEDGSLDMGIEVVNSSYLSSIEDAMKFLDDFFEEYTKQSTFFFDDKITGLHTNIGYKGNTDTESWNLFKAYLFLNESFATRGFEDRLDNNYSASIKEIINKYLEREFGKSEKQMNFNTRELLKAIVKDNPNFISEFEEAMNNIIYNQAKRDSGGYSGFSVRDNRIEFRYPGGDIAKGDLKSATMYYCYLVELATNPEYKKRDYLLKAVKFAAKTISDIREKGNVYTYKSSKVKLSPKFSKKYLEKFISKNGPYIIPYKGSYLGLPNLYGYELYSVSAYLNKSYFKNNFKRDDLISYGNISELCINSYENLKSKIDMASKALVKITNIDEEKNLVEFKWASARMNNLFQINIYDSGDNRIVKYDVSFPTPIMGHNKSIRLDKLAWLIQNNDVEGNQGRLESLDLIFEQMSEREKILEFMKYVNPNLAAIYEIASQKGVKIINISDESSKDAIKIYDYLTRIK